MLTVSICCVALASCDPSGVQDRTSTFAGRWVYSGAFQSGISIRPEHPLAFAPAGILGQLDISSTQQPNLVEVGHFGFFGMGFVPMRVVDDSALAAVPFTSSPVTVTCPPEVAATCATPTSVVTLEGGIGTLADGMLTISLHGKATQCCMTERFVFWLAAVRQ
jgi:hypothetical protein